MKIYSINLFSADALYLRLKYSYVRSRYIAMNHSQLFLNSWKQFSKLPLEVVTSEHI